MCIRDSVYATNDKQKFVYAGAGAAAAFILALFLWFVLDDKPVASPGVLAHNTDAQSVAEVLPVAGETPVVEKTPSVSSEFWSSDLDRAMLRLTERLDIPLVPNRPPCWTIEQKGFVCETDTVPTWVEFRDINRPAVLTIQTPSRRRGYVTLIGLSADTAWVVSDENAVQQVLSLIHI